MTFADPASATVAGPTPPPTVMRGPAHADNYRIKVGRYGDRWYRDPLPYDSLAPEALSDEAYPSFSIVKGASGKDWTYVSLQRIAHADDLTELATKGYYERYERFKVINSLDLSAAQRRGTNVHIWAECIAYGVPQYLTANAEGANYFPVVDKFFEDHNPTLVAAEFVCIHRTLNGSGYGGTSDGIFEIGGKLYMVDWKSRGEDTDHACYPEEAGQEGAYYGCEYIIVEDDNPANPYGARRDLMPQLDGGLIVSIKPDSYEVFPVDLDKAVDHFHAMHAWWCARRSEAEAIGSKWAPRRAASLEQQLQDSLDYVERKKQLYARHDRMTRAQQQEFAERVVAIDTSDLDVVERLLDDVANPPTILDMAKARMEKDAERETARHLSLEGGRADPDDVKLFELRWDMGGVTDHGKRWIGRVVNEAIVGGRDFRLSTLNSQRRADIYNALTEWAAARLDVTDDAPFRAAMNTARMRLMEHVAAGDASTLMFTKDVPLGVSVGSLTTTEAAELRLIVTEIAEGRLAYVIELDGPAHWQRTITKPSAS